MSKLSYSHIPSVTTCLPFVMFSLHCVNFGNFFLSRKSEEKTIVDVNDKMFLLIIHSLVHN